LNIGISPPLSNASIHKFCQIPNFENYQISALTALATMPSHERSETIG
jgi:hypothetical protein